MRTMECGAHGYSFIRLCSRIADHSCVTVLNMKAAKGLRSILIFLRVVVRKHGYTTVTLWTW